jgi:hypothetical protein
MVNLARPLPERLAGIGVVVLALVWGLSAALANRSAFLASDMPLGSALLITVAGGTFAVAGVWFGVGAVMWAMGRLLGGKARFVRVLLAVSAAAPPLWIAAPAWMLVLAAQHTGPAELALALLGMVATIGFVAMLVVTLGAVQGFTARRSCGCIALGTLFCASYLSLH